MQKPQDQRLESIDDIASRDNARLAIRKTHSFLKDFLPKDQKFKNDVFRELTPLYGELSYTPGSLANGAQVLLTITVASAQLGYCVEVSYDQDLQGFQKTEYCINGSVKVVLKNDTGAPITLSAGILRAYVWPRRLVS